MGEKKTKQTKNNQNIRKPFISEKNKEKIKDRTFRYIRTLFKAQEEKI